jgi:hypothetical protein
VSTYLPASETLPHSSYLQTIFAARTAPCLVHLRFCASACVDVSSLHCVPGHIPNHIGKLANLSVLRLQGNHLVGPIPESIGDLMLLEDLDLSSNHLKGTLLPVLRCCFVLREGVLAYPCTMSHPKCRGNVVATQTVQSCT